MRTSAIDLPGGSIAVILADGGTGMTSEQSVSWLTVLPRVVNFIMAAWKLLIIVVWSSVMMSCK